MSSRIQVGPPVMTIHQGDTFLVSGPSGEVTHGHRHGFFAKDTRLVSLYRLLVCGQPWVIATSAALSYRRSRSWLLSPELVIDGQPLSAASLELSLERDLGDQFRESLCITSYAATSVLFDLEIEIASDFADIFDVKGGLANERGHVEVDWDAGRREYVARYRNGSFKRGLAYRVDEGEVTPRFANGRIRFDMSLAPRQRLTLNCRFIPLIDEAPPRPSKELRAPAALSVESLQERWRNSATRMASSNDDFARAAAQAVTDIGSLRLYEHDTGEDVFIPAAGVPWFVTVFGRDSIITSLQTMHVSTSLALGTLQRLAELQARQRDDARDAQPGKIVHEVRFGELALLDIVPHAHYFGTADATILWLILLSETWRWTGDEGLLHRHHDTALRCLDWIDRYGDLDGDGFQEYKTFAPKGYHNQSWKDAGDALVYPDGRQVEQPIATCELQGYVFDAKLRLAELIDILGDHAGADELRRAAGKLKQNFNAAFWMETEGTYAFALDPDKQQVRSIASNPGHLLWSGIVDDEARARRVIERLLAPDMHSGWGIRTLSSEHPAYNPHSYQRGSVWPHDNALIAAGARRYGLWREANHIAEGILDACGHFKSHRLPELFAGLQRRHDGLPVQYLDANTPQAWASGSIFLLLRTILGIEADATHHRLRLQPRLPDWLPDVVLSGMRVGDATLSIRFSGHGDASRAAVIEQSGDVEIDVDVAAGDERCDLS